MSKSKRLRYAYYCKEIPESKERTNKSIADRLISFYYLRFGQIEDTRLYLADLFNKIAEEPDVKTIKQLRSSQVLLIKAEVIEYFVLFDEHLNAYLYELQRRLGVPSIECESFDKVDEGLKKFFPDLIQDINLNKLYTRIQHFRNLRNQFAHYSYGQFVLSANQESFESFIKTLEGIEIPIKEGLAIRLNSKAGFILEYQFSSNQFTIELMKTGSEFYEALVNKTFPQN